jgi:hypothetical protein
MTPYEKNIFINCPFDAEYRDVFRGVVFGIQDCGFMARCSLEADDGGQSRMDKLCGIISECGLGIHDISRTEPDPESGLPRFNMPLELGLFLGAKRFGNAMDRRKLCLILDRERHRYQRYCSDIAGQDIWAHADDPRVAIRIVRDWLRNASVGTGWSFPGGSRIAERYARFSSELPTLCEAAHLSEDELIFNDFIALVEEWLHLNTW